MNQCECNLMPLSCTLKYGENRKFYVLFYHYLFKGLGRKKSQYTQSLLHPVAPPPGWVLESSYSEALDEGGGLLGINAVLILVLWREQGTG